ncbi:MAG: glutaredoxin family protein [Verrucomicrobia bacterium]|nr:glutaredoxin family protein [Verrucomicrobiota bacterium]
MKPKHVRLFIKPYCGWCHQAAHWLDDRGIQHDTLDVTTNSSARQEMIRLSGQSLAPVIEVDGQVLADFATDELEEFWARLTAAPAPIGNAHGVSADQPSS